MWAHLVSFAIGIWLMAAPAVLALPENAADHEHIVGPIVASFGLIAASEVTRGCRWVVFVLGLWLVAAPFVLDYGGVRETAMVNEVASGICLAALSLVRGKVGKFGGGWRAIWKPVQADT